MSGNPDLKICGLRSGDYKKSDLIFWCITIIGMMMISGLFFPTTKIYAMELFWEQEFKSQVKDVAFRDIRDRQDLKVFPVSAVATQKEIIFYDEKGNEVKSHKLQPGEEGVLSRDGTFYAIQKHREGDLGLEIERIILFNNKNDQVEEIKSPGTIKISPDNKYFVITSLKDNYIDFYDLSGRLNSHQQFDHLRKCRIEFSNNGEYCLANIVERLGKTRKVWVILYDRSGKEVWRFHESMIEGKVAISADGRHFIFASEKMAYSFSFDQKDNTVNLTWRQKLPAGGIDVAISDDGKYVAITREANHRAMMFDNSNGRLMWRYDIEGELENMISPFTSVEFIKKGLIITAQQSGEISNNRSFLFEFDFTGDLTMKKDYVANAIRTIKDQNDEFCGFVYSNNLLIYNG